MPGTDNGVVVPSGSGPDDGTNGPAAEPELEHCVAGTVSIEPVCWTPGGTNCRNSMTEGVRATVVIVTWPLTLAGAPATV